MKKILLYGSFIVLILLISCSQGQFTGPNDDLSNQELEEGCWMEPDMACLQECNDKNYDQDAIDACMATCPAINKYCDFSCGDGTCNPSEDKNSCPTDCSVAAGDDGMTGPYEYCGDGTCNQGGTEDSYNCPGDCGYPGDSGMLCGDGSCDAGESRDSCPQDCGLIDASCGDGACNSDESPDSCPQDCTEKQHTFADACGSNQDEIMQKMNTKDCADFCNNDAKGDDQTYCDSFCSPSSQFKADWCDGYREGSDDYNTACEDPKSNDCGGYCVNVASASQPPSNDLYQCFNQCANIGSGSAPGWCSQIRGSCTPRPGIPAQISEQCCVGFPNLGCAKACENSDSLVCKEVCKTRPAYPHCKAAEKNAAYSEGYSEGFLAAMGMA